MSETLSPEEESIKSTPLIALVIILHTLNHVIGGSMPILFPDIMNEFNLSYSQLGILRSGASFASGFPQMFVGFLRRWFSGRVLIGLGNLVNSVMHLFAALSSGFYQFFGLTILGGVGSSAQHPIGASLITASTDRSKLGRMLGLNQSVPSLAFSFTPVLTVFLLTLVGWRSALALLTVPSILASVILLLFIRGHGNMEAKTTDALNWSKLKESLKNRNVISISILRSVMAFRMGVQMFLPLYFINVLGLSYEASSLLYSIMLFGGVFGPFFWGYLSDRMNRKPLIIGIIAVSALGFFLLNYVTNFWSLIVLLFIIGFMVQTVVVQSVLSDSVEKSQMDQIFGLYFSIGFTLASVSNIIFGYIVEFFGFNMAFTYIAGVSIVSLIPAFFIKDPRIRNISQ
jgi:FSR family fosmidomycin resistance protein-like MFS transporter